MPAVTSGRNTMAICIARHFSDSQEKSSGSQLARLVPFHFQKVETQTFGLKQLEPRKTYGIWFEFDNPNLPDIVHTMTINSPRGTNEFGVLPLQ